MKNILLKIGEAIAIIVMLVILAMFMYLPFLHDSSRDFYEGRCMCPHEQTESNYANQLRHERYIDSLNDVYDDSVYIISIHDMDTVKKYHGKYSFIIKK